MTYDAFGHFCCSIIPFNAKEGLMAMFVACNSELTAYFDESGKDRSHARVFTLAGYIATVGRWKKFQRLWQRMLNEEGLDHFHMTDLESFKKQFHPDKGWDKERQIRVIKRAHAIIKRHTLQDFDISLIWEHFDIAIQSYKRPIPPPAYAVLVNAMISRTAEWAHKKGYTEPIEYVFENIEGAGWVVEARRKILNSPSIRRDLLIGDINFKNKRQFVQLQAADINAYETWKQMENRIIGDQSRETRKSIRNLKEREGNFAVYRFTLESLTDYIKNMASADADDEERQVKTKNQPLTHEKET